jgi:hypothetical protein
MAPTSRGAGIRSWRATKPGTRNKTHLPAPTPRPPATARLRAAPIAPGARAVVSIDKPRLCLLLFLDRPPRS